MQVSADGPPRESICRTAISVSFGYKNRNKTQSSVRYCHISAPISVLTRDALPNVATSADDGDPKISESFGALTSGSGVGFDGSGARAVSVGAVEADCGGPEGGVTPSSTAQPARLAARINDTPVERRDLGVTVGFRLVRTFGFFQRLHVAGDFST